MTDEKGDSLIPELWEIYYTGLKHKDLVSIRDEMLQYSNSFNYFTTLDSIEQFTKFFSDLDFQIQSRLSNRIFGLYDKLYGEYKTDFDLCSKQAELLQRYKEILDKQPCYDNTTGTKLSSQYLTKRHLLWMIEEASKSTDIDKANRWLGYIQGVLAERGIIDLKIEIELARSIFKGKS